MNYPARVGVGVAFAVAICMWGVIEYFRFESAYQKQNRDPYQIAAQAGRLAGLVAILPESESLGYTTDLEPGSIGAISVFNATQYILAPRLILQDTAQARVLGNFSHPVDYAAIGHQHGLLVERDFQSGVILFRKESAK